MPLILIFFLTLISPIFSQQNNSFDVKLLFSKQSYVANEPIDVTIFINNSSKIEQEFTIADAMYHSLGFELWTSKHDLVPLRPEVETKLRLRFVDPTAYRKITLFQNESFSQNFNLREFYDLDHSGTYYIKVIFYPNPDDHGIKYTSEFELFIHTPPRKIQEKITEQNIKKNIQRESLKSLLPNEVVQSFFESQRKKDWDFFLYHIDPEKLINSFRNFKTQYDNAFSGELRIDVLEQFVRFFTVHWNIPLVSYTINETIIKEDRASVTVDAIESISFAKRRIRYTFELYRSGDNSWLISDYIVLSLN